MFDGEFALAEPLSSSLARLTNRPDARALRPSAFRLVLLQRSALAPDRHAAQPQCPKPGRRVARSAWLGLTAAPGKLAHRLRGSVARTQSSACASRRAAVPSCAYTRGMDRLGAIRAKTQATETLAAMGLSVSDAVRMFLTRVVAEQQLPFALKAPNADIRAAMEEARTISKARFASAKALKGDLEKGAKR